MTGVEAVNLGRMAYDEAYAEQLAHHDVVLRARETGEGPMGRVLLVEHEPVVTVSRRPTAAANLLATPETLARHGVRVAQTDRGGDITYHGPGQLVMYPILDLKRLRLGVHGHVRLMEQAVIDAIAPLGLHGLRDAEATGVWLGGESGGPHRKLCAIGVRVRKWVTLHGLAVNVSTDLDHFTLIVPCGLAGRPVTSLRAELGATAPDLAGFTRALLACYLDRLAEHAAASEPA